MQTRLQELLKKKIQEFKEHNTVSSELIDDEEYIEIDKSVIMGQLS